jgi:hypothetical protein
MVADFIAPVDWSVKTYEVRRARRRHQVQIFAVLARRPALNQSRRSFYEFNYQTGKSVH